MSNAWLSNCSDTLVYSTIVTVIIHHTLRLHYIALFIMEIFFLWRIVKVRQPANVAPVNPLYCCPVALESLLECPPSELHCLVSNVLWHTLPLNQRAPQLMFFFFKLSKIYGEEMIDHVHFVVISFYLTHQFCYNSLSCCQLLCLRCLSFPK